MVMAMRGGMLQSVLVEGAKQKWQAMTVRIQRSWLGIYFIAAIRSRCECNTLRLCDVCYASTPIESERVDVCGIQRVDWNAERFNTIQYRVGWDGGWAERYMTSLCNTHANEQTSRAEARTAFLALARHQSKTYKTNINKDGNISKTNIQHCGVIEVGWIDGWTEQEIVTIMVYLSVTTTINQSINQSVNQSINQSSRTSPKRIGSHQINTINQSKAFKSNCKANQKVNPMALLNKLSLSITITATCTAVIRGVASYRSKHVVMSAGNVVSVGMKPINCFGLGDAALVCE
jgi:hypothetical protein